MELIPLTVTIGDGSLLSLYIVMAPNFGTNTTGTNEFKFDQQKMVRKTTSPILMHVHGTRKQLIKIDQLKPNCKIKSTQKWP